MGLGAGNIPRLPDLHIISDIFLDLTTLIDYFMKKGVII